MREATQLEPLAARPRWETPDAALREALMYSPLRGRGIDYARVPTTDDGAAVALDAVSRVLAVLGRFSEREQQVLIGYAMFLSYRQMAKTMGISDRTVRRLHAPAWEAFRDRLIDLGLIQQ